MHQNYIKHNTETASKSSQNRSPLLCYRFVSTTLTAQISSGNAIAKPLGSNYSPFLHYHCVGTSLTMQIPNGNTIANLF